MHDANHNNAACGDGLRKNIHHRAKKDFAKRCRGKMIQKRRRRAGQSENRPIRSGSKKM